MQSKGPGRSRGVDTADHMLSSLLATEQRLKRVVDDAHSKAESIVRDAHVASEAALAACDQAIAQQVAALEAQHEAGLRERLLRLSNDAQRSVARFDTVDERRTRELVDRVVARVMMIAEESG